MPALLFGSISTLADTSERQRTAFNDAFAAHGLDWHWDRAAYRELLTSAGGRARVAADARRLGHDVDADAVHATKSELFRSDLGATGVEPRPGVVAAVRAAREAGEPVALVTTTSRENVDALLQGLAPNVSVADFDVIVTADDVTEPKPHPAAYETALERLGIGPAHAVAVEDNVDGVAAATAAGVRCVAVPNENTAGHDFSAADAIVDRLAPEVLA
ncbi:MAG: HAD-IA family hydrolase [Actinomycetota bacterium]